MTERALKIVKRTEPWRQRLIRGMLYGRNVDRAVKARARVGFAMLAFAAIFAVIGGRLVMFALGADNHAARRTAASPLAQVGGEARLRPAASPVPPPTSSPPTT